ncbi:phage baseplate assembly protein V [Amycolatopsis sp. VS8301801F10]|uniref:phage baseplate assembly protein V n=1 Tax=Amycolatopsis sp. VS8301801F10 TaxID=2652442 RepID=UPI0038FBF61E
MTTEGTRFDGTYEGVVVSNVDPLGLDRLLVRVVDVLGDNAIWAAASTAAPGMNVVPLVNSGVWVEFQGGDIGRAVWTGFRRDVREEGPPIASSIVPGVPQVVIGTPLTPFGQPPQNYLLITQQPGPTGGIQLQIMGPSGPYVKLNETGIELSCGPGLASIRLAGTSVVINNGTFVVPN